MHPRLVTAARHAAAFLLAAGTLLALPGAAHAAAASGQHPDPNPRPDPDVETESHLIFWKILPWEGSKRTELRCHPAGGEHPNAEAACRALDRVDGDIHELNLNPDVACPAEFEPAHVLVRGVWRGRDVAEPEPFDQRYFANKCELYAATGPVFDY